jgi:osmotically-inducible protein OsmY
MTDKSLEQCVRSAVDWEPSLDASDIGVSVEEGIVTLRGYVGSYAQKVMAEQIALRCTASGPSPTISTCTS